MVRRGLVLLEALKLVDAQGPILFDDLVEALASQLDGQLTPFELSTFPVDPTPPRWRRVLWHRAGDLRFVGWVAGGEHDSEPLVITHEGRATLAEASTPEEFERAYSTARQQIYAQQEPTTSGQRLLHEALRLVGPGEWTTFRDLGDVAAMASAPVGRYVWDRAPEPHRVLARDGYCGSEGGFAEYTQTEMLEMEGLVPNEDGRFPEERHVRASDLRAALEPTGFFRSRSRAAWSLRSRTTPQLEPTWLGKQWISVPNPLGSKLDLHADREQLRDTVSRATDASHYSIAAQTVDALDDFLNHVAIGDAVIVRDRDELRVGTVTGEAELADGSPDVGLVRRVEWLPQPLPTSGLNRSMRSRMNTPAPITRISENVAAIEALFSAAADEPDSADEDLPAEIAEAVVEEEQLLRDATPELAAELHVPQEWLQECIELLRERPQLVFYGPPGTGKTYLAKALANHLASERVRLVQFHPAYSYEDFFEGFRPNTTGGFELRAGPLRKVVDEAAKDEDNPYFLIIDEINRGNLAKIFGELYFLLEYRGEAIELLYGTDGSGGFRLPENVFIIGTMNTADRSIALMDSAMRRRFAFLPLDPVQEPTKSLLRTWLAKQNRPEEAADLLDALNARIADPDFKIGPSYLMRDDLSDASLERVWRTAILPLLEEHHYGEGLDVARLYGLSALRGSLAPSSVTPPAPADAMDEVGTGAAPDPA